MSSNTFTTADLCDAAADELQVCAPLFKDYGGHSRCSGPIATIKCFEDNSRVREVLDQPGEGRVLVIDAGGSTRCAVLGDMLAKKAVANGWSGVIVHGAIRDSAIIATLPLGVKAIATCPLKSVRHSEGQSGVQLRFGSITCRPGDWVYADEDGVVFSARALVSTGSV